jgi:excisionase family DNA binding protein
MTALDRLRQLIEVADPDGTVTVRWLAALLKDAAPCSPAPSAPGDLTLEDVCTAVAKKPSTVRGWLNRGELRGYKLNGKAWRVPRAALDAYLAAQANPDALDAPADGDVDITEWRKAS